MNTHIRVTITKDTERIAIEPKHGPVTTGTFWHPCKIIHHITKHIQHVHNISR